MDLSKAFPKKNPHPEVLNRVQAKMMGGQFKVISFDDLGRVKEVEDDQGVRYCLAPSDSVHSIVSKTARMKNLTPREAEGKILVKAIGVGVKVYW